MSRGGDGRDVKAAQNALLAKHHQRGAESPEAAHDGEAENRAQKIGDAVGIALGENSGIEKEKSEGHDHAEKEKHFVAQGQLHAHAREREQDYSIA